MPRKKKWYKRWFVILPLSILAVVSIASAGLIGYVALYPSCSEPITYSFGSIDKRFGLTHEKLMKEFTEAESVWEDFRKSNLFEYSGDPKNADILIDFVYDSRQKELEATRVYNSEVETYNRDLKTYEEKIGVYEDRLALYKTKVQRYEADFDRYNKDVVAWNKSNRRNGNELNRLNIEKTRLKEEFAYLDREVNAINLIAKNLQKIQGELEMRREHSDEILGELGTHADELIENGNYDPNTDKITIFRYEGDNELKWLLAHELGHALGLDHVSYPRSVMYYMATNMPIVTLSNDDVRELSRVCADY